jgi:short-subunit dehydrogenase involved in D-alanine esterification of teichoic acids
MNSQREYQFTVTFHISHKVYSATCPDMPGHAGIGLTPAQALRNLCDRVLIAPFSTSDLDDTQELRPITGGQL